LSGVGVVAALASEARALGPSMPHGGTPIALYELALLGDGALLAVSGIGLAAAAAAAAALIEAGASALMSFGLAGALDPALEPGSVVLPSELLLNDGRRYSPDAIWRERLAAELRAYHEVSEGPLLTSDRAIDSPEQKAAAFHGTGAVAVDMEGAAVAEVAAKSHLPFVAVRVIVDTAADRLPRAVVAASRTGRLKIARLVLGVAASPAEIPMLIRLAQRYRVAMRSLRAIAPHLS
jgi:adenosylhomocysteine nucleosidase